MNFIRKSRDNKIELQAKFLILNQKKMMYYCTNTNFTVDESKVCLLFIHGGSRRRQNIKYWEPIIQDFSKVNKCFFVDLLGHGKSVPGPDDWGVETDTQAEALSQLLIQEKVKNVIIIGRSYGGKVASKLSGNLKKSSINVKKLIYIAPAITAMDIEDISPHTPVKLFWAKDDNVIEIGRSLVLKMYFYNIDFTIWEKGKHIPEMTNKSSFIKEAIDFILKE